MKWISSQQPKPILEEIEILNRTVKSKESVIKNCNKEKPKTRWPLCWILLHVYRRICIYFKTLPKKEKEEILHKTFYEARSIPIARPIHDKKKLRNKFLIDVKILNKILPNLIQQHIKGLYIMTKWHFCQEWKVDSKYENYILHNINRIKGETHMLILMDAERAFGRILHKVNRCKM